MPHESGSAAELCPGAYEQPAGAGQGWQPEEQSENIQLFSGVALRKDLQEFAWPQGSMLACTLIKT